MWFIETMVYNYSFKVLLLGDYAVGKSSLIKYYLKNEFNPEYYPTLMAIISEKILEFSEFDIKVTLSFWEVGGERRPDEVCKEYFLNTNAIIYIFEVTRIASFDGVDYWYEIGRRVIEGKPLAYLVGNKVDLPQRVILREIAERKANKLGAAYFETSAKTGFGVQALFRTVVKDLLRSRFDTLKACVG